jgi:hypothetical protein
MAPVPFSRRRQRDEQDKLTPERILSLARRPDGFHVSWRYRDDWLRKRCGKMVRDGVLKRMRGVKGCDIYLALKSAAIRAAGEK